MKYIKKNELGFMSYDAYFSYLGSIRHELGEELFSFASNPARHDLSSAGSLHDAWVASLELRSSYLENNRSSTTPDVRLVLLGQYHDRLHTLSYFNVQTCRIDFQLCSDGRKRDLLQHELRYEDGRLEHEFVFDGDMAIEIHCGSMKYEESRL